MPQISSTTPMLRTRNRLRRAKSTRYLIMAVSTLTVRVGNPYSRRCETVAGRWPMRLRHLLCAPSRRGLGRKPAAFRQAAEPKEINLEPAVRKGRALPHSRRQSRDVFTPSKPWEEGGIYRFTK